MSSFKSAYPGYSGTSKAPAFNIVKLKNQLPQIIPDYLISNQSAFGISSGRHLKKIEFPNQPWTPSHKILRLEMPKAGIYDFKQAHLTFEASCSQVGGTYVRFADCIWNLIYQIKVLVGNKEIQNLRSYGLKKTKEWEFGRIPNSGIDGTYGYSFYGVGTAVTRNGWAAGRKYMIPLDVGFLNTQPIDFGMIAQTVVLEITLETPANVLETDGNTYTYTVTNTELSCDSLDNLPDAYVNRMRGLGSVHYDFQEWDEYITEISTQSKTVDIPHASQAICSISTIMRNLTDLSDPTINDKFKLYNYNNTTSVQFKINHKFYPERPLDATGEALELYMELIKSLGHWSSQGEFTNKLAINSAQYVNNKFNIAITFDEHPHHLGKPLLNDFELEFGNTFQMVLTLNAPPPVSQQLHTFVSYSKIVIINNKGGVEIIK